MLLLVQSKLNESGKTGRGLLGRVAAQPSGQGEQENLILGDMGWEEPWGSWWRLQGIFKDHFCFHRGLESRQLQGDEVTIIFFTHGHACARYVRILVGACCRICKLLSGSRGHSSLQVLGIPGSPVLGIVCSITWACSNTSTPLCTLLLCMRQGSCLQSAHMAPVDWEPSRDSKRAAQLVQLTRVALQPEWNPPYFLQSLQT